MACDSVLCGCATPARYIGILESTKIKTNSPVRSHAASGRYQPWGNCTPRRVEWLSTLFRDLSPTCECALRGAFAGPTPQQSRVRAGQESGCPTFPHRPVKPEVACRSEERRVGKERRY